MDGTIGEIRMFAATFAPLTWAFCQGQLLSIAQNTALFSIIGTTYGGDGQTTFSLPNLQSRSPFGTGQGLGLGNMILGEVGGNESVTLTINNLPAHSHTLAITTVTVGSKAERPGPVATPVGNYYSILPNTNLYSGTSDVQMAPLTLPTIAPAGGNQPVPIRPPYIGMNFIICLEGIYPSQN